MLEFRQGRQGVIELRTLRDSDKDQIRHWRNLPEIRKFMYSDHEISPEEHENWFRTVRRDPQRSYWIIVCDGVDVGLVNLYARDEIHKRCYWAFYVAGKDLRGRGVGSFVEWWV